MSSIGDFVKGVVVDVLQDMLKKPSGKRAKRRKGTTTTSAAKKRKTASSTPAKRQTSRKSTVRTRSKAKQRSY